VKSMEVAFPTTPTSPAEILALNLEVGVYPGPSRHPETFRELFWHQRNEGYTNWNIRVFDSTNHLAAVTASWTPHILVAHWHGEYDERRNVPVEIAARFRRRRGEKLGRGPFLAGQISRGDRRFSLAFPDGDDLLAGLLRTFDMMFEASAQLGALLEIGTLLENMAIGITNRLNWDSGGNSPILSFGPGFNGYFVQPDERGRNRINTSAIRSRSLKAPEEPW
jgi:hypothetical protein